ncbi:hypothetical protein PPERSA_01440 [Pseudocohnilembus persalinus]|uniref:Uncharacterized protein n=1 Tax=Pseudocohnilembus persalinus TaxID=266149 RepID=A0A0V0QGX1_PSEPJ|nr:hypothetical protein PPERSA_01440 [Pseudocohnilembus persalinus]|eukprot:KRX01537.1 hypothetical protein PPERSA_01440 [Pseudocohnilembus persalinus]
MEESSIFLTEQLPEKYRKNLKLQQKINSNKQQNTEQKVQDSQYASLNQSIIVNNSQLDFKEKFDIDMKSQDQDEILQQSEVQQKQINNKSQVNLEKSKILNQSKNIQSIQINDSEIYSSQQIGYNGDQKSQIQDQNLNQSKSQAQIISKNSITQRSSSPLQTALDEKINQFQAMLKQKRNLLSQQEKNNYELDIQKQKQQKNKNKNEDISDILDDIDQIIISDKIKIEKNKQFYSNQEQFPNNY